MYFTNATEELLKQMTWPRFHVCTSDVTPFYETPRLEGVFYDDLMKIPQCSIVKLPKDDIRKLLTWRQDFGKGIRQQAIRSAYTKDRSGTLPLCIYSVAPTSHEDVDLQKVASPDLVNGENAKEMQKFTYPDSVDEVENGLDKNNDSTGEIFENLNLGKLSNEFAVIF